MPSNETKVVGTSKVASNDGRMIEVQDLVVASSKIHNFVERNRTDYFEDHSLDWALDEILTRGMAEIERQIKSAKKAAEQRAAGAVLKEFNVSPEQAKALIAELLRAKAEHAKADAEEAARFKAEADAKAAKK